MIEEYIPAGYENRVSRQYLHEILHLNDRVIRDMIADAWERGVPIYSDSGGYFRRGSENDDPHISAYSAREDKRFRTLSHKRKLMRIEWEREHPKEKKTREIPGQMSLFEV